MKKFFGLVALATLITGVSMSIKAMDNITNSANNEIIKLRTSFIRAAFDGDIERVQRLLNEATDLIDGKTCFEIAGPNTPVIQEQRQRSMTDAEKSEYREKQKKISQLISAFVQNNPEVLAQYRTTQNDYEEDPVGALM